MSRDTNALTPEIIIATLKRSDLKTVLIEGKDDKLIYNQIEEQLEDIDINILPCNGRSALLKVYEEKDNIDAELLFICDSDLWVFDEEKLNRQDLISTEGYSIENELYQDGYSIIEKLLTKDELERKEELIKNICHWFSFEVEKYLENRSRDCKFSDVSILNKTIMAKNSYRFCEEFLIARGFEEPNMTLKNDIIENYSTKLRGKYIFQVFEKIFQERGKGAIRYRTEQLFDMIFKTVTHRDDKEKIMNRRKQEINVFFMN